MLLVLVSYMYIFIKNIMLQPCWIDMPLVLAVSYMYIVIKNRVNCAHHTTTCKVGAN
jgi:hypothetical protein